MRPIPAIAALMLVTSSAATAADLPAFPGAEGFGAGASGGRGGDVYAVTNLDDSGPGSLRDAVSSGNRTVVFRVSGTIQLKSRLTVSQPNITIAGQTAPGDGITLRDHELFIKNTDNIIVRFIRSRPGDEAKVEHDAITIWGSGNVIVDHCSMSWSTDSLNDVVKGSGNVTVQWCILSEPLNNSVHVKGAHGYATGWDGRTKGGGSYHHNLLAHAASRAPRIGYLRNGSRGLIDCRNNVIYNSGPSYGGETDNLNFVANYYRPGPRVFRPDGALFHVSDDTARAYIAGNVFEGRDASNDNRDAITFDSPIGMHLPTVDGKVVAPAPVTTPSTQPAIKMGDAATCLVADPFKVAPVVTQPAEQAYKLVVARAGAMLPNRDAVDLRILDDVKNRTGKLVNSQKDVGGWPELKSTTAPKDTDNDGIPDAWETAHQLDPGNASDGRAVAKDAGGYTNLEVYLNELAAPAFAK